MYIYVYNASIQVESFVMTLVWFCRQKVNLRYVRPECSLRRVHMYNCVYIHIHIYLRIQKYTCIHIFIYTCIYYILSSDFPSFAYELPMPMTWAQPMPWAGHAPMGPPRGCRTAGPCWGPLWSGLRGGRQGPGTW